MNVIGLLALIGSALGVAFALVPEDGLTPLSPTASHAVLFVVALAHLAGAARGTSSRAVRSMRDLVPNIEELALYAPSGLLLTCLPWVPHALGQGALSLLSLWLLTTRASRDPLEPRLDAQGRGRWELNSLATLLTALAIAAHYLSIAGEMASNRQNDAAYYHGVARWMARTGTLDEPIVWHFLTRPEHAVHPAFDYWQGLTSILLALPMALFGGTHEVATYAMASLSGCSVLAFAYLITRAHPLRHHGLQLAALLAFGLTNAMQSFRFDTETPVVFHMALLGSLIALVRKRWILAAVCAFLCFLTRTDGAVTTGLLALILFIHARRNPKALAQLARTFASVSALYLLSNLLRFGTLTPPGSARAPALQTYFDLYIWTHTVQPPNPMAFLEARLSADAGWLAFDFALDASQNNSFVLSHEWLVGLLALGIITFAVPRRDASWLLRGTWLIAILATLIIPWLSPVVFSRGRTFHPLIPVFCLASFGAVAMLSQLQVGLAEALQRKVIARTGHVAWFGIGALLITLPFIHPYRPTALTHLAYEVELAEVNDLLHGAVVGTNSPWWVIANTDSPAVLTPFESTPALLEMMERYEVEYLLFTTIDRDSWGEAAALWSRIRDREHSRIGPYSITRVASSPSFIVLRVDRMQPREF